MANEEDIKREDVVIKSCTMCKRDAAVSAEFCEYHAHDKERQAFHVHNKLTEEQGKRYRELFVRTKSDILQREMTDEQLQEWIHNLEETLVELIFVKKTELLVAKDVLQDSVSKLTKDEREKLREKDRAHKYAKRETETERKADSKSATEELIRDLKNKYPKMSTADAKLIAGFHIKQKLDLDKAIAMVMIADGM